MTEITTLSGNRTTGSTLSTSTDANGNAVADGPVFIITATYWTDNADALTVATGQSEIDIYFQNGGSVLNPFGSGAAISSDSAIRLTVNAGSSLVSGDNTIDMFPGAGARTLTLINFGLVQSTGTSSTILAGNGNRIDNYGEISNTGGGNIFIASLISGSTINNYGTFSTSAASAIALDLGNLDDTVNNYGMLFGKTNLYAGTDTIFNAGTIRAQVAIDGTGGGDKTIFNTGFIGTIAEGGTAIVLGSGNDRIDNVGTIFGNTLLGGGDDEYVAIPGGRSDHVVDGGAGGDFLLGNDFNDLFSGGANDDTLSGRGGDDALDGGTGADAMIGGYGNDVFSVDDAGDVVDEDAGQGTDAIRVFMTTFTLAAGVSVEEIGNRTFTGATITGNELVQTIVGDDGGNDVLSGGGNGDTLNGRAGDDTYALGAFSAAVIDNAGNDLVTSTATRSIASFGAIERLTLLSGNINGTGNALINTITGSSGNNVLDGGANNDTLLGLAGNDILIGNSGKDTLTGGSNNDMFRFLSTAHSTVGANADVITDFDKAGDDRIDLSSLRVAALTYRHNLGFTAAGQVRINDIPTVDLIVEVNLAGSLAADMQIRLTNTTLASMNAGDFFL